MHADAGAIAHQRAAVDDDWKLHCAQCTGREANVLISGTLASVRWGVARCASETGMSGPVIMSEAKIFPTVILSGVGAGREAKDLKLRRGR